jgi:hypothetical protein
VANENDLQMGYLSAEHLEHRRERPKKENIDSQDRILAFKINL